jgi:hypothetical protein
MHFVAISARRRISFLLPNHFEQPLGRKRLLQNAVPTGIGFTVVPEMMTTFIGCLRRAYWASSAPDILPAKLWSVMSACNSVPVDAMISSADSAVVHSITSNPLSFKTSAYFSLERIVFDQHGHEF